MRDFQSRHLAPRGFMRLGTMVWLLILAGVVYLGVKLIPPYWDYLLMLEPVKEAAMAAATPGRSEDRVRAELMAKAKEVGLDLAEENVQILRQGNFVVVRATWEVPVDFPRYRYVLHFQVESQSLAL
jgi:hypothetical protein